MASVNTQFSIAVHIMAGIAVIEEGEATSSSVAESVNTTPSFVRRVLSKLAKAGLVKTTQGKGGFSALARKPNDITLLDIYQAIEAPKAFAIHEYPSRKGCHVSCNIKPSLTNVLEKTQKSLEGTLKKVTLAEVLDDLNSK